MTPIIFPEVNQEIAKNQPEYFTLPAHIDQGGCVTCCWKLEWRERLMLLFTGKLWHQILTFNSPLQPQLILVHKPTMMGNLKGIANGL